MTVVDPCVEAPVTTRRRVLLVAPTCDGEDVGEAWVAFQWARHLGELHDLTVLTYHKRGHTSASAQLPGVRVVEWSEPRGIGRFERFNSLLKPGYAAFYLRARRWITQAQARGERFDVVHQPLPVAMRYPSPATGTGLPVVLGPVGGGLDTPPAFRSDDGATPWFVRLRSLDAWRLRHDRTLRRTYAEADVVLGIAPYVEQRLCDVPVRRFEVMSETALEELPPAMTRTAHDGPLRLLHVGRLVRTKGVRDVLRAMSLLTDLDLTLDVVGAGPDQDACERLAASLGLADRVTFHGWLGRDAVARRYRQADVFVFPSYREPGGNAPFEAMGHGLPLVVCDRGGPGAAVDTTCAEAVPVSTPDRLALDVAAAVRRLAEDPQRRLAMGRAARARVAATALWPAKARAASRLYEELVEQEVRDA